MSFIWLGGSRTHPFQPSGLSSAVVSLSLEGGNLAIFKLNRGRLIEMKNSKHIIEKNNVSKM